MQNEGRVFLFGLVLIFLGVLPWWITFVFIFILNIYIPNYLEMIFFGFLIDALYSDNNSLFSPVLVISFVLYGVVNLVRTRIRT